MPYANAGELVNIARRLIQWGESHPGRAGTLMGWYQQGASALTALIAVPLVIRYLSEVDAGLWFAFQTIVALVQYTDFGLSFVIARQIAFSLRAAEAGGAAGPDFLQTRPGWLGISDVYWASRLMFRWVSVIGVLILVVLYHLVLPQGKLLVHATGETAAAWYLLGGAALVTLQAKPHQALLDGLAKLYLTRFLTGTGQLLAGFGAVTILLLGGGLAPMAGAVFAMSLVSYLGLRWLVRRTAGGRLVPVTRLPAGLFKGFIRVATPMGLLNLSAYCVSYVQVPVLGSLLGPRLVPAFYLAQKIGQLLNQGVMQVVFPQLPLFTQEYAGAGLAKAAARMKRCILWVSLLALGANLFFFFLSPVFVDLWVGPGRYVSRWVLLLMSVDYWLMAAAVVWGQFVLAAGRNPFLWITLCSGALNITFLFVLLPPLGLLGVPIASLLAGVLANYWFVPWQGLKLLRQSAAPPSHAEIAV